jgi:hypothetical protein
VAISDTHGSQPVGDRDTKGGVIIAAEVVRLFIPRKCFGDLSGDPFGGQMCGHIIWREAQAQLLIATCTARVRSAD